MEKNHNIKIVTKVLAICVIISTILCWKLIYLPINLMKHYSSTILLNCLIGFPAFPLCLTGGIGILLQKRWGYYCIYIALIFSILGSCIPYIPFVFSFSNNIHYKITVLLISNVFVTSFFIYSHILLNKEKKDNKKDFPDSASASPEI